MTFGQSANSRWTRIGEALNPENRHRRSAAESREYADDVDSMRPMSGGRTRSSSRPTRDERNQEKVSKQREKDLKRIAALDKKAKKTQGH